MEDHALVEALRRNDPGAARLLVDRYQGVVLGLCLRMLRHRQDAEDVAQESLVRALRAIRRFDGGRPLRPWLLGIAANRCRTALSRRGRRPVPVEPTIEPIDHRLPMGDPDDLAAELDRAVSRLRDEYRLVFVMYHEQGLPYEEIAQTLERPIGTVKTWLHRARAEMAEELARRGVRP